MKILFLGSSSFSTICLSQMLKQGLNVVGVITQPDRPSGRGHKMTANVVKSFAMSEGLKVYTFDRLKNHIEEIKNIDYDIACVASFGQILPKEFLDYRLTINVHPSLLPKYRGASPIQSALLNCDKVTGVTIMKVALKVDSGDIILQKEYEIGDEYYRELEEKLATLGGDMVAEVVKQIENGSVKFIPQDESKATEVSKFDKSDGKLDFSQNAEKIVGRVKALSEEVGCFIDIEGKPLKIGQAQDVSGQYEVMPKQILNFKKSFVIGCENGAVEILSCQAPSGKMISGRDYLNGHNDILGKMVD